MWHMLVVGTYQFDCGIRMQKRGSFKLARLKLRALKELLSEASEKTGPGCARCTQALDVRSSGINGSALQRHSHLASQRQKLAALEACRSSSRLGREKSQQVVPAKSRSTSRTRDPFYGGRTAAARDWHEN